jgi:uncharacterized protein (TIGR01777 family)
MKTILIFGANSFLGSVLIEYFLEKQFKIIAITRSKKHQFPSQVVHGLWDGEQLGDWVTYLDESDYVINLSGKSVNCRYNKKNKAAIYSSRITSTQIIQKALHNNQRIKAWLNSSSATIYAHSPKRANTEKNGIIGTGFSVEICQKWEETFFQSNEESRFRKVALRSAIVLGKNGGVLPVIKKLAHRGFGGKMGNGEQYFSWIHSEDFCRAVHFILENDQLEGPINLASPYPVKNHEFQFSVRLTEGIRCYLNQPKWLLEFGAKLIRTETELVLKSRYVLPQKLQEAGFQFKHPNLLETLQSFI